MRRDWTVIVCVLLVALATVTASFTAQAGLGELAGWTTTLDLFGVAVNMSWLLPITVDAYGIAATRIATNKARYAAEVRGHAFGHALAAVTVSVLGNAVYHLLEAKVIVLGSAAWVLVVAVSVVPPIALGGLAHLLGIAARGEADAPVPAVAPLEFVASDDGTPVAEVLVERLTPSTKPPALPSICGGFVPAASLAPPAPTPVLTPAPDELFPVAAQRYAAVLAEGKVPAVSKIKTELRVGQPRAAKIRGYLVQLAHP